MSRVGNNPILIPDGVNVQINPGEVVVSGKLGTMNQSYDCVVVEQKDNQIVVSRNKNNNEHKSKHGLYRSLFANMVKGVSEGFTIELELVGVGYRASNSGQKLEISLGFLEIIAWCNNWDEIVLALIFCFWELNHSLSDNFLKSSLMRLELLVVLEAIVIVKIYSYAIKFDIFVME